MRKSRAPDTELNFDGLTDAITNLAGSLILLVVLLFAMTRSQELGTDERPIADG